MKLFQLRYTGRGAIPTAKQLADIRDRWLLTGEQPEGIVITPTEWSGKGRETDARAYIAGMSRRKIGRAGVVKCAARPEWTYCDYDTARPPALRRFWWLARLTGLRPDAIEYDRTRRGWHVLVRWDRALTPIEQVAIQAALGSDYRRETYNLARVLSGKADDNPAWNLLFERKVSA